MKDITKKKLLIKKLATEKRINELNKQYLDSINKKSNETKIQQDKDINKLKSFGITIGYNRLRKINLGIKISKQPSKRNKKKISTVKLSQREAIETAKAEEDYNNSRKDIKNPNIIYCKKKKKPVVQKSVNSFIQDNNKPVTLTILKSTYQNISEIINLETPITINDKTITVVQKGNQYGIKNKEGKYIYDLEYDFIGKKIHNSILGYYIIGRKIGEFDMEKLYLK